MNTNQRPRPTTMLAAIAAGLLLQACSSAPQSRADASDWKQSETATTATPANATQSSHPMPDPAPPSDQGDWKQADTVSVLDPLR